MVVGFVCVLSFNCMCLCMGVYDVCTFCVGLLYEFVYAVFMRVWLCVCCVCDVRFVLFACMMCAC